MARDGLYFISQYPSTKLFIIIDLSRGWCPSPPIPNQVSSRFFTPTYLPIHILRSTTQSQILHVRVNYAVPCSEPIAY